MTTARTTGTARRELSTELRADQSASVDFIMGRPRSLLLSEPGTGKTAVILDAASRHIADGRTAVLAVPAALVEQVVAEARLWTPHLTPRINRPPTHDDRLCVVSHQRLGSLVPEIIANGSGIGLLGVDEAHRMATVWPTPTNLNRALQQAVEIATRSVLATGTPVDCVAATDLMGLLRTSGLLRRRQWHWLIDQITFDRFDPANPRPIAMSERGASALGGLLERSAISVRLDDLDVILPTVRRIAVKVGLTDAQRRAQAGAVAGSSGLARARRLARAGHDPDQLALRTYIWRHKRGKQHRHVVIITDLLATVRSLSDLFEMDPEPTFIITGETSARERSRILEEHRTHGGVLIMSAVGGTGFNLQHCSLLIEVCTTWEAEKARQRIGRIVRPGSPHPEVTHLRVVADSVDESRRAERRRDKSLLAARLMARVPSPSTDPAPTGSGV